VLNTRSGKKRQNTRLESEGAEFLVLGNLLVEGIDAYKSYRYMPGYDLVAVLPEKNSTARIQVKSRWASDATGYLIKNYDAILSSLQNSIAGFGINTIWIGRDGAREKHSRSAMCFRPTL
jgi:hypothetical protein